MGPPDGSDFSASDILDVLLNHHDLVQVPILLRLVADRDQGMIIEMLDVLAPEGPIAPRPRDAWRSDRWVVFDGLLRIAADYRIWDVVDRLDRYERLASGNPAVLRALGQFR